MNGNADSPRTRNAAGPLAQLNDLLARADALAEVEWRDHAGGGVDELVYALEQVQRRLDHVQAQLIAAAEGNTSWAAGGFRSVATWLQALTGGSRISASRSVKLSRALRDELPLTAQALSEGRVGREHAQILQREATKSLHLRNQLHDPEMGEAFLLGIAEKLTVDDFRKAVKHWATSADPEASERDWREETDQEEVFLSAVGDSYYLSGRLNKVSGRALEVALTAQMGRKAQGDDRSPAGRRAAALVSWAHSWLDSGHLSPNARIRPHLSVHVPFETLAALSAATGSAAPNPNSFTEGFSAFDTLRAPDGPRAAGPRGVGGRGIGGEVNGDWGANRQGSGSQAAGGRDVESDGVHRGIPSDGSWADTWKPGADHVISSAIDYEKIRGLPPATLDDGTPLPPSVLSRIACGSQLTRIVFGPESTILDVGRQQRIFPASQTRGIIARDRHCQYPSCTEPPEFGEIHHSLWWWKHNGRTSTDQGILLCWHHHAYVHQNNITIARTGGEWKFSTEHGRKIVGEKLRKDAAPTADSGLGDCPLDQAGRTSAEPPERLLPPEPLLSPDPLLPPEPLPPPGRLPLPEEPADPQCGVALDPWDGPSDF